MEVTICKSSQEDLKKLGFLTAIIFMSFNIDFTKTNAVYVAVFVQAVSNLETFWTIRENPLLNGPTKGLVTIIVISSFVACLLSIGNWYQSYAWMGCSAVKYFFVLIVMLPVLFWGRDFFLNNKRESKKVKN